jgi:hypothetical protein
VAGQCDQRDGFPKPPEGEEKLAVILEEKISELAALDPVRATGLVET